MILFLFVNDNALKFPEFTIILLGWNHEIAFYFQILELISKF